MKTTTNTAKKMYKVFAANHNGDVKTTSTKLNIITGENRIDVDMTVDRKTLKGAYNVFIKAVEQAVADGALDSKTAQFAYFADDINDINFDGKDSVTFADNNCDFAYGIDDNSNCDLGFYFWFFVKNDTNEVNPDDYAVNPDAFDEAVNAEIALANNKHAPEYKYYIQSRRPIAGAVPNGYISATAGEMKVHSLRSDGSISPVPRKVVFGVVVYDHPLSDQQIINYDLHVDPLNPKVEPDTTELSDEEIAEIKRRSQINAIKSRIATYERAIERQYDQELENRLIEAKAQLAEIEPDTTPQVDPIIQERDTARNEYDQLNAVRKVIEKDCERYERLRDRCKSGSPKHKEYNQLLADFDPIIRAFGEKFIAAQDRYNQSLTLRTSEEIAATQKAIDTHNADLDARGIKYFATVYYFPNGIEGEDMETFHKDCTSLAATHY